MKSLLFGLEGVRVWSSVDSQEEAPERPGAGRGVRGGGACRALARTPVGLKAPHRYRI